MTSKIPYSIAASLTRILPFYSGTTRIVNSLPLRYLSRSCGDRCWVRLRCGCELFVLTDDSIGRMLLYTGDFDRKISWVCSRLIRSGDTVLDIGANLGCVTALMSCLVGKRGQVYSFEPNPQMLDLFRASKDRNRWENVKLFEIALGDNEDRITLAVPKGNAGKGSLVRSFNKNYGVVVPVRPLSLVLENTGCNAIRLVKLDVEGYEPQVIRGAQELFEKIGLPDAVLFEMNDRSKPFWQNEAVLMLKGMGYGFVAIPKCILRMRTRRVTSDWDKGVDVDDYIAIPLDARKSEIERVLRVQD